MRPAGPGTLNFLNLVIKSDYSDIALQHRPSKLDSDRPSWLTFMPAGANYRNCGNCGRSAVDLETIFKDA
jgi:hypothetical protein